VQYIETKLHSNSWPPAVLHGMIRWETKQQFRSVYTTTFKV